MSKGNKQKRVSPDEERLLNSLRVVGLTPFRLRRYMERIINKKDTGLIMTCAVETLLEMEWGVSE